MNNDDTLKEYRKRRDELAKALKIDFGNIISEADEWRLIADYVLNFPVKVEIEVQGGVVNAVHSDKPNLVVDIFDWDDRQEEGTADKVERDFEDRTKGMKQVY